jgi:protein-disulfide isomerase
MRREPPSSPRLPRPSDDSGRCTTFSTRIRKHSTTEALISYATELGLDRDLIESALRGNFAARVRRDFDSGVRSGVNGTPSLFINGEPYDGPRDAGTLVAVMRQVL